jgi:DNA repair protein RadC
MFKFTIKRQRVNEPSGPYDGTSINGPDKVARIARELLQSEDQEVFLTFFLNSSNKVLGYSEVARGTLDSCPVDSRIVFRAALAVPSCTGIVLAHNHPSGNAAPSDADRRVTKALVAAGKLLNFTVLDHVIVGDEAYSFRAEEEW